MNMVAKRRRSEEKALLQNYMLIIDLSFGIVPSSYTYLFMANFENTTQLFSYRCNKYRTTFYHITWHLHVIICVWAFIVFLTALCHFLSLTPIPELFPCKCWRFAFERFDLQIYYVCGYISVNFELFHRTFLSEFVPKYSMLLVFLSKTQAIQTICCEFKQKNYI